MSWLQTSVVTRASDLPIAVAELKDYMRVDHDDEDAVIEAFLHSAIRKIEGPDGIGYAFRRQTWQRRMRRFPCTRYEPIELCGWPVADVGIIRYVAPNGNQESFVPSDHPADYGVYTDMEPVSIYRLRSDWPTIDYTHPWPVTVQYSLGVASNDEIPDDLLLAAKMLAANWYENREGMQPSSMLTMPYGVQALLNAHARRIPGV